MKQATRFVLPALVVVLCAAPALAKRPKGDVVVTVTTDRPKALYKCGEPATFAITAANKGKPITEGEVAVSLTLDQYKRLESRKLKLGSEPARITGTLKEPGFLHCAAVYRPAGAKRPVYGVAAAGYEPLRIKPAAWEPKDFDAFWAASRAEAAAVPPDVRLKVLPKWTQARKGTHYKFSMACLNGKRIYGYLSVPTHKPPPYPAVCLIMSASYYGPPRPCYRWSDKGAMCLFISVHPYDFERPREEIEKIRKSMKKIYIVLGAPDREKYYFRHSILGIDRAIDYLASRPDYDKKHLVVTGGSQGGGLTIMATALNKHVTAADANIPGFCDQAAFMVGRRPAWPRMAWSGRRSKDPKNNAHVKMAMYYDAVNFARRIKVPVIMSASFADYQSVPGAVYGAYNSVTTPKGIVNGPGLQHETPKAYRAFRVKWAEGQLGLGQALAPTR